MPGSAIDASFRFSELDGNPAIDGTLKGSAVVTCQRCMKPLAMNLEERFQVLIVRQEQGDEPGGYEPVVADPSRLDLRWLAEEQVLLALPLVAMHETNECDEASASATEHEASIAAAEADDGTRQKPFQNLRDMLRKH